MIKGEEIGIGREREREMKKVDGGEKVAGLFSISSAPLSNEISFLVSSTKCYTLSKTLGRNDVRKTHREKERGEKESKKERIVARFFLNSKSSSH